MTLGEFRQLATAYLPRFSRPIALNLMAFDAWQKWMLR